MGRAGHIKGVSQKSKLNLLVFAIGLASTELASAATISVNSSADTIAEDAFCTLREAIINANNNNQSGSTDCAAGQASPTDVITFSGATNNVPIVLSRTGSNENAADTGDLDLTESVIINGNGAFGATEIDGNGSDRVFEVRNGAAIQMYSLGITNGGSVTVGAGIYVFSGQLTMQDARVYGNLISAGPSSGSVSGAGISTRGPLSLTRVGIESNRIEALGALAGQGAGISVGTGGSVNLVTSRILGNTIETEAGSAIGGGLFNNPNNVAVNTGISSTTFSGNQVISSGDGGASGGAINHQSGTLSILRSDIISNLARRTSDSGSSVASGGAIQAFDPVEINSSTVSGNRVESVDASWGGGLSLGDSGSLNNVTVTKNRVQTSAGGTTYGGGIRGSASVVISNTVVAENTSSNDNPDCYGGISSDGYNLIGNNSGCNFTADPTDQVGDVAGGDAALAPMLVGLAANGGNITIDGQEVIVLSHAPEVGSPLVDAGDPSGGTCQTIDQTGWGRVDGDDDGGVVCDIGAVEYREGLPAPIATGSGGGGDGSGSGGSGGGGALSAWLLPVLASLLRRRRLSRKP